MHLCRYIAHTCSVSLGFRSHCIGFRGRGSKASGENEAELCRLAAQRGQRRAGIGDRDSAAPEDRGAPARQKSSSIIRRHRHHHQASSSPLSVSPWPPQPFRLKVVAPLSPRAAARPGHLSQVRRLGDVDVERDRHRVADSRGVPPRGSPGPSPELCRGAPGRCGTRVQPLPSAVPGKAQGVPARGSSFGRKHESKAFVR